MARLIPAGALLLAGYESALAHDPGLSTGQVRLQPGQLEVEMIFAQADVQTMTFLDLNGDGRISANEWTAARASLARLARENVSVETGAHKTVAPDVSVRHDASNNVHFSATFPLRDASALTFHSGLLSRLPRGHRQFVTVIDATGRVLSETLLSVEQTDVAVTTGAPAKVGGNRAATLASFLTLGLEHILTGYDHLLFLFALLLMAPGFRQTAGIITSFTVAHSITLGLATLDVVHFSPRLVEALIAASIVWVGIENLICRDSPRGRWLLTFAFGLAHGFGFAGVLREIGVSSSSTGVATPLLAFNLGVEAGQLAIAALVLPLLWWARKDPRFVRHGVPLCSAVILALGSWWFVERTVL